MATLPGTADLAELGGILQNLEDVSDPTTDLDAGADNKNRANTAALTHTATRAICSFVGHGTTPTFPNGFVHESVWGATLAVRPALSKSGTGVYLLTYLTSVSDELGEQHTLNFRRAKGWAEGSVAYHVQAEIASANVVRVRVFDMAGNPADAVGVTINVEVF
jgi:hypothetical protein